MKMTLCLFCLFNLSLWAQSGAPEEEIYTCVDEEGKKVASVFLNPRVFCGDMPVNPATLLQVSEHGSVLYKGDLLRRVDNTGENFYFSQTVDGMRLEIFLELDYEINETELILKYDEVVEISKKAICMMRQVHVACD
ncbi:MAG: hypothetical protein WD025_05135 [Bacteriovoracaceae bacterium]